MTMVEINIPDEVDKPGESSDHLRRSACDDHAWTTFEALDAGVFEMVVHSRLKEMDEVL